MATFGDLTPEQLSTPVKPTQAAKLMQFPPQYIYNYIKQGAPTHPDPAGGKVVLVVIAELLTWKSERDKTVKLGRPQAKAGASRLKDGQMFMYTAKPGWGVGICQHVPSPWALENRANGKTNYLVDFRGERGSTWVASVYGVSERLKARHLRPISVTQGLKLVQAHLTADNAAPAKALDLIARTIRALAGEVDDVSEIEIDIEPSEGSGESEEEDAE